MLAVGQGFNFDKDTNTRTIVYDLFTYAKDNDTACVYIAAYLEVAARHRLLFGLPKSRFFVQHLEFVGIAIGAKYKISVESKYNLSHTWPKAQYVRTVASCIAFGAFYSTLFHF